jgi:hypothetical protein
VRSHRRARERRASWYSSNIAQDPNWVVGLTAPSDIWQATLDLKRLPRSAPLDR